MGKQWQEQWQMHKELNTEATLNPEQRAQSTNTYITNKEEKENRPSRNYPASISHRQENKD